MPPGWRLTDLDDVWLGAPSLPASSLAADYRIGLSGATSRRSWRTRAGRSWPPSTCLANAPKGTATVAYDLRPLVDDVPVARGWRWRRCRRSGRGRGSIRRSGPAVRRRSSSPSVTSSGRRWPSSRIVRERLILADELRWAGRCAGSSRAAWYMATRSAVQARTGTDLA